MKASVSRGPACLQPEPARLARFVGPLLACLVGCQSSASPAVGPDACTVGCDASTDTAEETGTPDVVDVGTTEGAIDGHTITPPTAADIPVAVDIPADVATQVGFASPAGDLQQTNVSAFRMAKWPVSVAAYRACVAAGACTEPASQAHVCTFDPKKATVPAPVFSGFLDTPTYTVADTLPVTCVEYVQASQYCGWVGGRVPTEPEWMLAARGVQTSMHAWGSSNPTCEQYPGYGAASDPACIPEGTATVAEITAAYSIGKHSAGASPYGVEDVLLARGELLTHSNDAGAGACTGTLVGCKVYDTDSHGVIGGAEVITNTGEDTGVNLSDIAAGFRCAFAMP